MPFALLPKLKGGNSLSLELMCLKSFSGGNSDLLALQRG